jgi:hypothetical protein
MTAPDGVLYLRRPSPSLQACGARSSALPGGDDEQTQEIIGMHHALEIDKYLIYSWNIQSNITLQFSGGAFIELASHPQQ